MKFGGTSVRDASCIQRVAEIIRAAAAQNQVAVVVSAMSGVTNQFVEIANLAEAGDRVAIENVVKELRDRHEAAANALIQSPNARQSLLRKIGDVLREGDRFCEGVLSARSLSARSLDAISGLGECLSTLLVAAALSERGVACEAIVATDIIITDACHGAAEPDIDLTTARCEARLRPLLRRGVIPVVTGFIGGTVDGVATTLGRNSSDFSGTLLGAALGADEVTLWTDVDGILTADPKLVPGAHTIAEMSYREATELADLGAKVLHPKTLSPVRQRGIPLVVRNTFAPERPGTKITLAPNHANGDARVLVAQLDQAVVTLRGIEEPGVHGPSDRVSEISDTTRTKIQLVRRSESKNDIAFAVPAASASCVSEALRQGFTSNGSRYHHSLLIQFGVALITVVGRKVCGDFQPLSRILDLLERTEIRPIGVVTNACESSFSIVVEREDVSKALTAMHQEVYRNAESNSLPFEKLRSTHT
jgi:bifunctional aspartokinase / homoserine dehydrogenase 1